MPQEPQDADPKHKPTEGKVFCRSPKQAVCTGQASSSCRFQKVTCASSCLSPASRPVGALLLSGGGGAEAGAAGPRGRGAEQLAPGLPEHGGGRVLVLLKSRNPAVTILERGSDWATPIYRTDGDLPTMPGSTDFVLQGAGRSRAWRVRRSRQHLARE